MINYDLNKIRAIVFDIDGVLSAETISLSTEGVPQRTVNIKDGYAIQLAMKLGLRIIIITGATTPSVRVRYEGLGVEDVCLGCAVKIETYDRLLAKYGLTDEEVMYMGDDIPDLEIMRRVGCPVPPPRCPSASAGCGCRGWEVRGRGLRRRWSALPCSCSPDSRRRRIGSLQPPTQSREA